MSIEKYVMLIQTVHNIFICEAIVIHIIIFIIDWLDLPNRFQINISNLLLPIPIALLHLIFLRCSIIGKVVNIMSRPP